MEVTELTWDKLEQLAAIPAIETGRTAVWLYFNRPHSEEYHEPVLFGPSFRSNFLKQLDHPARIQVRVGQHQGRKSCVGLEIRVDGVVWWADRFPPRMLPFGYEATIAMVSRRMGWSTLA